MIVLYGAEASIMGSPKMAESMGASEMKASSERIAASGMAPE